MNRPIQQRTLKTRARLLEAATEVISEAGYEALRVEQVVQRAGVAKGTFFAHFRDKDALMDQLIGARMDGFLDQIDRLPPPQSVDEIVAALMPLMSFMTCERYVFDLILRYSGAAARADIGPIAMTFERHGQSMARWLSGGPFRSDVSPALLAEGVQAFAIQAMALSFCALHADAPFQARLAEYLRAWLLPVSGGAGSGR
ncbi:TetR/AcrR family transcriptional regulator [Actibacterium ureilyticum]|uniref:TetR/AcrR family transcriptional regulator n=1 Tax=Actibacterium ureilyticum TaxID=1590614 RepID=UPI000BAB138A|nr:TetR/AcrR family transcriptional regulator [Actibacterium ureilyticum]